MKENISKYFLENKYLYLLFLFFVIFHNFFEKIISISIINPFLSQFKPGYIINISIFFAFILVAFLLYFYVIKKRLYFNSTYITSISILIIIYSYYRFNQNSPWQFIEFQCCKTIKYLDLIPLLLFFVIINSFLKNKYEKQNNDKGFEIDEPIRQGSNDKYGRRIVAEIIAKKIVSTNNDKGAFSIGIYGDWGSGKTSFLNLISENLKKDENIIYIKFNPWLNFNSKGFFEDFFNVLSNKLSEYHFSIKQLINVYKDTLIINMNTKLNLNKFKLFSNLDSEKELKKINKAICQIGKKIVIEIDDIDRLQNTEILSVLKLIRNSANFNNVVFLLGYDRKYLIHTLDKNIKNVEKYIEKIFQLEIPLPVYDKNILKKLFYDKLKEHLTESHLSTINDILFPKHQLLISDKGRIHYDLFENSRDIIRFINLFIVSYELLKNDIEILDLINLEILRTKYPNIYEILFVNFEEDYLINPDKNYIYASLGQQSISLHFNPKTKEYLIISFIKQNNKYDFTDSDIENIRSLLQSLFPDKNDSTNDLSISNPIAFYRYSYYHLLEDNVPEIQFQNKLKKGESEFCKYIKEQKKFNLVNEINSKINRIGNFRNKKFLEKKIKFIFCIGREILYSYEREYRFDNLLEIINDFDKYQKLGFYNDLSEFYAFIEKIIDDAPEPYEFEFRFIEFLFRNSSNLTFNKSELFKLYKKLIVKRNKISSKYDPSLHYYFNFLIHTVKIEGAEKIEMKKLFIEFIKKDLDGFLCGLIQTNNSIPIKYRLDTEIIEFYFPNVSDFIKTIVKFEDVKSNFRDEFLSFYNTSHQIGFKETNFPFKKMKKCVSKNNR